MRRILLIIIIAILVFVILVVVPEKFEEKEPEETETDIPEDTCRPGPDLLYEAEDAELEGLELYTGANLNGVTAKSGCGYVGLWDMDESRLTFHVDVPESGMYELEFLTAAYDKESYNTVVVNDRTFFEALCTKSRDFGRSFVKAGLQKGSNVIIVETGWYWIFIDCMRVRPAEGIGSDAYSVDRELINGAASDHTRRLMSYLADQYGKYTLSGQYNNEDGVDSPEVHEIYKLTGRYPAIMGFDFVDYSPSRTEHGTKSKQTEYAIRWSRMGGIVTFVWHWNAPKDLIDTEELPWWKGFYTEATTFHLGNALNGRDPAGYELLIRDIDVIAKQLKILADRDIPVLWRPLHEASGGYFWWGAYGAENYKKLWKLLYERLTYTHQLNNLIWIYNGQSPDWYPGDEYVDMIAEDVYTRPYDYESHYNRFSRALEYTGKTKMIGLSEIGVIPDPDLMYRDHACWLFFITWNDEFIVDKKSRKISDQYNGLDHFIEVYNHSRIVTLDELPRLDLYPID